MVLVVLVEMWRRFCLVSVLSVVLHQQDQDEGRDAEDQAGEGDHDGRDDLLDPDEWGDDGVRLYGENRGEVGVEGLEPCHRAQISTGQQSLKSEGVKGRSDWSSQGQREIHQVAEAQSTQSQRG